jgi:hypothetical protein
VDPDAVTEADRAKVDPDAVTVADRAKDDAERERTSEVDEDYYDIEEEPLVA